MSSIMRARSGLTRRWEGSGAIRGSFLEPKVARPSMLGIGRPDRHALPRVNLVDIRRPRRVLPSRASGFVLRPNCDIGHTRLGRPLPDPTADLWTLSVLAEEAGRRCRVGPGNCTPSLSQIRT